MDHTPAPVVKTPFTPATWTTRRGIATSSFCLGLWGTLVFWWYPFGIFMSLTGTLLAIISLVMGWKAGKDGEHLAWLGLFFAVTGVSLAIAVYRFQQMFFEGSSPGFPLPF